MRTDLIILSFLCSLTKPVKSSTEKSLSTTENIDLSTITIEDLNITTTIVPSLGSCGGNSETNNNNCTQLNATDANSNRTNNTNISKSKKNASAKTNVNVICTCNLQYKICDLNCCCDPDCSVADKTVFKYCNIDENRHFDDRYCNNVKQIYVNNTPFDWEVNQDGLFCVIASNLPKSRLIQTDQAISTFKKMQPKVYYWQSQKQEPNLKKYNFGDAIMMVKNDSTFGIMSMAKNVLIDSCVIQEGVLYLKNDKSVCSQSNIDEENAMLSFATFFQDFKVVGNPKLMNLTKWKTEIYKKCPKNICLEIEPKLCDINLKNCSPLNPNATIKFQCFFNIKKNLNNCQNAIKKVYFKFYHNATFLQRIEVLGVLSNFSYHFGNEFQFFQEFSVEFLWINQTVTNYSRIFSGNPGYIFGKPILTGTKLANGILQRNSSDFLDNFLVLPKNIQKQCVKNETFNIPIEFGYNLLTKCSILITEPLKNHNKASEICKNIQNKLIFDLWGIANKANHSALIYGSFGNAHSDNSEWNEVSYNIKPNLLLNNTNGRFLNNKNTTLICYNLTTLIDIEIFYSRIDFESVLNQNKILGVRFNFGDVFNKSFNKPELLEVISRVSFYDVTQKKTKKFVEAPSFDFKLPYDFFYPFIKIESGGIKIMPNNAYFVFVIVGILCI